MYGTIINQFHNSFFFFSSDRASLLDLLECDEEGVKNKIAMESTKSNFQGIAYFVFQMQFVLAVLNCIWTNGKKDQFSPVSVSEAPGSVAGPSAGTDFSLLI